MVPNNTIASKDEIMRFYQAIGQNVKKKRKDKKMTQMELALQIGISSVAFYSNCETCRYDKHFNLEHLYKIAKVLDIHICELLN